MAVNCLALDYDGTVSPMGVPRRESRVPEKTYRVLQEIGSLIPVVIVTTKDLSFVTKRTRFAYAWSGVSGLERKIGDTIARRRGYQRRLRNVSSAIEYAKSHITDAGVEIEEKRDVHKRPIAFCIDWRRARNVLAAIKDIDETADYCKLLGLKLIRYGCQPFFDVYPVPVDKGVALKDVLEELRLKRGILYVGDSEADNPAFEVSDLGVGVIHERICRQKLICDYFVRFEDVSSFLSKLLANGLLFDSAFSMIRPNLEEMGMDA